MSRDINSLPKVDDFVAVTIKHVEWYGYVVDADYDIRSLRVLVEFHPYVEHWFDMKDVTVMEFPVKKKDK